MYLYIRIMAYNVHEIHIHNFYHCNELNKINFCPTPSGYVGSINKYKPTILVYGYGRIISRPLIFAWAVRAIEVSMYMQQILDW